MFSQSTEIPPSLLQLGEVARSMAMEIANTLRSVGVEESKTLRISIAAARHLAAGSFLPAPDDDL